MESHSFTCCPHMNHTGLYFPAARRHCFFGGTHCTYPRRDGQAEMTWVAGHIPRLMFQELNPDTITNPSTNRARRRLTPLIETNRLPMRQITTDVYGHFSVASEWKTRVQQQRKNNKQTYGKILAGICQILLQHVLLFFPPF